MSRGRRRAERTADPAPEAAGHRHARLQHILFDELDAIVRGELTNPKLEGTRVTAVELSPDTRNAKVWYVHPDPEEAGPALERASGFIRVRVADSLGLKRVPELRFEHDRWAEVLFAEGAPRAPDDDGAAGDEDRVGAGEEGER